MRPLLRSDWDEDVYVGLGSNVGDRDANIQAALRFLDGHPQLRLRKFTGVVETEPWGPVEQPKFLNSVALCSTGLDPEELLETLKAGERSLGRTVDSIRWGPRVIDMDILLFGARIVKILKLEIPHPQILDRDFVLEHLLELTPDLVNPHTGQQYSK